MRHVVLTTRPSRREKTGFFSLDKYPDLEHFSKNVGQVQARQNARVTAWDLTIEKPLPFNQGKVTGKGIPGTELVKQCGSCRGRGKISSSGDGNQTCGHCDGAGKGQF